MQEERDYLTKVNQDQLLTKESEFRYNISKMRLRVLSGR